METNVEILVGIVVVGDADADDPGRRKEPADGTDQRHAVRDVGQVGVDEDDVRRSVLAASEGSGHVDGYARELDRRVEDQKTGKPAPDPAV
jgi:hypothetical protein